MNAADLIVTPIYAGWIYRIWCTGKADNHVYHGDAMYSHYGDDGGTTMLAANGKSFNEMVQRLTIKIENHCREANW